MARLTYSVAEVAEVLGISETLAYEQIKAGVIPSQRIGRRIVVPKVVLAEWLSKAAS